MKKTFIVYIAIILFVLSVVVGFCALGVSNLNKYVFSPEICQIMLEKSPDEFCKQMGKDTLIEGHYAFSWVNKNGDLILFLSDKQKERWINLVFGSELSIMLKSAGDVIVSDNYTKCTARCYKETVFDDIIACNQNALHCLFIQAIEGKKSEDIFVDCYLVDTVTDEVKYHYVYPRKSSNENSNLTIDPDVFSSREQ